MDQRGQIILAGRHLCGADGQPRALRITEVLERIPDEGPAVFVLGYEASVAWDPRLPRRPPDPALGPDFACFRVEPCALPLLPGAGVGHPPRFMPPDDAARRRHEDRVRAARERIRDGVLYQANLAHRLRVAPATFAEGLAFFLERTAAHCPPCAAFVDLPGFGSLISLSPERFVMADFAAHTASAYPIKGTRPPALLQELIASEKDRAEHVMIVDLMRNDLGRLALAGGVTVERLLDVVSLPNVHHLESTITARLRDDVGVRELLEATTPGGSITGAPKSSAIETIFDLEDGPRGPYTGVLGVLDGRQLRSSLLIRTWIRPDHGDGALHVGGGIVADSDPADEWRETLQKARSFAPLLPAEG